ncbi:MAG TPA: MotA/TolQ/ExbB proton channel family protein [Kiritimatiellia bacterium]|nr:MotA/TolQ/ExbB proton channel family protein [Kiritimatiellia bacterium]HMO98633.1 MotA/TolQ/ExbB proton channel family protein [Kiritimatiellia bacterium]HMP96339.1 MotA/TolQ/ExbB proton channel family protein [Kiritimatiellia bacterium]
MNKVRWIMALMLAVGWMGVAEPAFAQEGGGALQLDEQAATAAAQEAKQDAMSFGRIVTNSGFMGIILWLALGACSVAGFALIVDSFITIREKKIVPDAFVTKVREAMEQGDLMKAMKHCEEEPGPLSSILTSGFSNVQEGFEAIQEAVGVSADLESEKLLQRVTYLNVVANLAPMLGLLGTVQGMIFAFATLGTQSAGAAQQAMLALNIAQALYTTAGGLLAAVPALAFFYYFRNRATKITLGMEALTMDLIKALRNVEVVNE